MREKLCNCGCGVSRRAFVIGATCAAALGAAPARARAVLSSPRAEDERFMRLALEEAKKGDFPFGAVIVREGGVAASGRNMGIRTNDPTAHGEMVAIRNFCASYPASELKGTTLYTTGEPCPMCMGAILWSGFSRMVYAASIEQLSTRIGQIMLTSESVARAASFETIEITGGVLVGEALALFR